MPPIIISIDGNIGSGKSTLIDILKCHYKGDVVVLEEPVDKWKDISDECQELKNIKYQTMLLTGSDKIKEPSENVYKNPLIVRKWIKEISSFLETFSSSENEKRIFKYYSNFPYETYIKEILSNKRNEEE